MSAILDFSDDYLQWMFPEPITFHSLRTGGDYMRDTIRTTRRRAIQTKEMAASGGVYTAGDVVWLIPGVLFPQQSMGGPPKEGDIIEDRDGNEWTVLNKQGGRRDAVDYRTFKCTTRNLVIAALLKDSITIETCGSGSLDAGVVEVKAWTPLVAGLAARVQPLADETNDQRGIRGTQKRYDVYLSREVVIPDVTRVRVPWAGGYLDVTAYKSRGSISDLATLEAVGKV